MTAQIRLYLEIGAAVVLAIAFSLFVHHERAVGAQKIEISDAKATKAAKDLADAQTAHKQVLATQAKQAADHEQQIIVDYARDHPAGDVRVCHANIGGPGVPQGSTSHGGTQSAGTGSAAIPGVPDATPGPNIGPGLTEIVLSAARLATLHAEWQRR